MKNEITDICDGVIKNYRYAAEKLRYDGDYINHFAALTNGYKYKIMSDEQVTRIKEIRSYVKNKTDIMSSFRGDVLYIISLLIAESDADYKVFVHELLETFNILIEREFDDCGHLVLAAYAVTKYIEREKRTIVCRRMKNIFYIMKEKYGSCTKQDDYLACALLAIEGMEYNNITEYIEYVSEYIKQLNLLNNNGLQGLTNTIIINDRRADLQNISNLLVKCEKENLKVGHQFLQLIGIFGSDENSKNFTHEMKETLEYLSNEEPEYYYYMDKDFRNMIGLVIVLMSDRVKNIKYIDELIAFGVYCFLLSKNQGILNDVLA